MLLGITVGLAEAVRPYVFMKSLRMLRWLDLSFNKLVELPEDALHELPALSICYLHSNRFRVLSALVGIQYVLMHTVQFWPFFLLT